LFTSIKSAGPPDALVFFYFFIYSVYAPRIYPRPSPSAPLVGLSWFIFHPSAIHGAIPFYPPILAASRPHGLPLRQLVYFGLLLLDDLTPQGAYLAVRAAWKLAYEDALMAKDVVRRAQNHPKVFISVYFLPPTKYSLSQTKL